MSQWIITYSRDEAAEVLKVESNEKPSVEEAATWLLEWAEENLEKLEPKEQPREEQTPAVRLEERFGITITGIARD
ncbi:hypothetical protein D16iCDA_06090 [Pseudomonas seleniipraecipitans]|jgi:hypothetical protein|uniref:Uncharacterized protein n=1 Tax=Phytopseudomonas seleniipraecipitans TaxID=640205 RepID=A0A1G7JJW3_9GAMM|nr:hypothetical protein [Pseudomonas seleniipraecipitans]NQD81324.1 hypothetical protein [Pseudomonas sp. CrR14]UUD65238.1 hypothetical protein D16iCDA_06090 [Pseudomonas seleniipraecipitans]SDF25218.1 hypothetical protein SAMN05216381_1153 [Pseudomonas seleniipraecipitans]